MAWGIYMTGMTMIGMLVLLIASLRMDDGNAASSNEAVDPTTTVTGDVEYPKAA